MIMKHFGKRYVETAPPSLSSKSLSQIIVRSNNKDAFLVAASISSPYHSAPWLPCRPILPYQPRRSVRERLFYRGISAPLWPSGIALCFPHSFPSSSWPFLVPLSGSIEVQICSHNILFSNIGQRPSRARGRERRADTKGHVYLSHRSGFLPELWCKVEWKWEEFLRCSDRPPCSILTGFMTKTGRKAKCIPFHPLTILLLSHFRLISKESSFPWCPMTTNVRETSAMFRACAMFGTFQRKRVTKIHDSFPYFCPTSKQMSGSANDRSAR